MTTSLLPRTRRAGHGASRRHASVAQLHQRYAELLAGWLADPKPQVGLRILLARDALQESLATATMDADTLQMIVGLDTQLRQQAAADESFLFHLAAWRSSYAPAEDAWWWHLDKERPAKPPFYEWAARAFAAVFLIVAGALLIDIVNRFLAGGVDYSSTLATLLSVAFLSVGSRAVISNLGQDFLGGVIAYVPEQYRPWLRLVLAALALVFAITFALLLPTIARFSNNSGQAAAQIGNLDKAQRLLERAIRLDPHYTPAHYNLGLLYEDTLNYEQAKHAYQVAVRQPASEYPIVQLRARNNLARLHILDSEYSAAVSLILAAPDTVDDSPTQARLLKNLGWARIEQQRYADSVPILELALQTDSDLASAHCLLGKALDHLSQPANADEQWLLCAAQADPLVPEEDRWLGETQRRLNNHP